MKISIKKFLCTLLSVAMVVSLAACGKSSDTITGGSDKTPIAEKFKTKNNSKGVGSIIDDYIDDNYTKESNKDLDETSKGTMTDDQTDDTPDINSNDVDNDNTSVDTEELSESDIERIKSNIINFIVSIDDTEIDLKSNDSTLSIINDLGYTYEENIYSESPYGETLEPDQYTMSDLYKSPNGVGLYVGMCNTTESDKVYEDCKIYSLSGEFSSYRPEEAPKLFIVGAKEIQLGSTTFTYELFDTIFNESYEYKIYKYDSEDGGFHTREIQVPSDKYYSSDTIKITWSNGYLIGIDVRHM